MFSSKESRKLINKIYDLAIISFMMQVINISMMEGNGMNLPQNVKNKISELRKVLDEEVIDVRRLRRLVDKGMPDEAPDLREMCWKVLLKYLPDKRGLWSEAEQNHKQTYQALVNKFMAPELYPDYPIMFTKNHPEFSKRIKDFKLWEQIEKDVMRTRSSISFFSQETPATIVLPYLTEARRQKMKEVNIQINSEKFIEGKLSQRINYIHDHMSRILFIYSKVNPNIGYVQGMNEILAPIFFTLNNHRPKDEIDQSACFFLLNNLMAEVIDLHMVDMDKSNEGIYGNVTLFNDTLKLIEPVLWLELRRKNIDPVCYNFKWLALLFAQQFQIFDVCRLWDSLLTYKNVKIYLVCVSLAIIQSKQSQIQEGDAAEILRALQELKDQNIEEIIENASEIYQMIGKKDLDKLVWEIQQNISQWQCQQSV